MQINPNMLIVNGTKLSTILSHYRHIGVLVDALKSVHHDWYALRLGMNLEVGSVMLKLCWN